MNLAELSGLKTFVDMGVCERTRTVFSSGGNTLFLYCGSGRLGCNFWEDNGCADRNDVVLIPLRVTVLQEHEDGEEDIEPELEDLEVRSSHCGCGSRGGHPPNLTLTSSTDKIPISIP